MSIILGIDPGSRITGYGFIKCQGRDFTYLDCGIIRLGDEALSQRLNTLFIGLQSLIDKFQPDQVCVEQVFMAKNSAAALTLGHARGVALLVGVNNGLQVHEYSAKQIKRAVVGTGAAAKQQVQHMVKLLLNLPSEPKEDAADALAAALCHAQHASSSLLNNKMQLKHRYKRISY